MMASPSPPNLENAGIIWHDIQPDFLDALTPGRYILRKRSETDSRCFAVLTAVQENSTGRGLQLFVNDLRQFFFMDGPPTWDALITRNSLPYLVHPGILVSRYLQCECLIHNVHLFNTVEMSRGRLNGDWKLEEKEVIKQRAAISETILKEYDCFLVDKDGNVSEELMGYFLAVEAVPSPKQGKKGADGASKRKADEKDDENDNAKKMKPSEEATDN